MLRRAVPMLFLFSLAVVLAVASAKATTLPPGGTPPLLATPFVTPIEARTGLTGINTVPTNGFSGSVADTGIVDWYAQSVATPGPLPPIDAFGGLFREIVFRDSASSVAGCGGGSCLTFLILVSNTDARSTVAIQRISSRAYGSFLVNAGYDTAFHTGFTTEINPSTVDRDPSVIGFNFPTPLSILPSQASAVLEIQTNATDWAQGTVSISQGITKDLLGFAPTGPPISAVEPASSLLLGVSLLMGGVFRKKLFA